MNEQAEWLLGLSSQARRAVSGTARPLFGWIGGRKIEKLISDKFAEHVVDAVAKPVEAKMSAVANALRVYGVVICAMADRNISHCACLRALGKQKAEEELKAHVEQVLGTGLDQLIA